MISTAMYIMENNYSVCAICNTFITHKDPSENSFDSTLLTSIELVCNINIDPTKVSELRFCSECREAARISLHIHNHCQENFSIVNNNVDDYYPVAKRVCTEKTKIRFQSRDNSTQTPLTDYLIIVNNLSDEIAPLNLEHIFSRYGKIQEIFGITSCGNEHIIPITFSNEKIIPKIIKQAQRGDIRYGDEPLMITVIPRDTTPIDNLNDDCLRLIFEKIDDYNQKLQLELVCKRWRRVARYSWSNIENLDLYYNCNDNMCRILSRCGPYLKHLALKLDEPAKVLKIVAKYCKNLKSIQLKMNSSLKLWEYSCHLSEIIRKCSQLKRVYLLDIIGDGSEDFDSIMEELPETISELRLVNMTVPRDISRFQKLTALRLASIVCDEDSLRGFEDLANLQYLSFRNCTVHPKFLEEIINFTHLEVLKVPNCEINDVILSRIIQRNPMLCYLDISTNHKITDQSFRHIARLSHLDTLVMNDLPQVTGVYLTKMKNLRKLCCNGSFNIKDLYLLVTIDACSDLTCLEADGIVNQRLLTGAEATVKLRTPPRSLKIYTSTVVYELFNEEYDHGGLRFTDIEGMGVFGSDDSRSDNESEWYSEIL